MRWFKYGLFELVPNQAKWATTISQSTCKKGSKPGAILFESPQRPRSLVRARCTSARSVAAGAHLLSSTFRDFVTPTSLVLGLVLLSTPLLSSADAQTPTCEKLKGQQKALAEELFNTQHPYDCCDDTIAKCIKQTPTCMLALRLAENICRRVSEGQSKKIITRGLTHRAQSMLKRGGPAKIDLSGLPVAGDAKAPVTLVEYACPRCPFCARSTPKMVDAVVNGSLKGKVKLYFKTFPLRSHQYSKESGLAFIAAAKLGQFWEYIQFFYKHFDTFSLESQIEWANAIGMDSQAFERVMADPTTRETLVRSKKEGIVNKVEATPTFYINGRKYIGDLGHEELIDVLKEEYERVEGILYRKDMICNKR